MATPAILIIETELPIMMTCLDNAGIEKGAVLVMASPMTVAANNADDGIFGGIAAEEKIANDGKTKIAVYRGGIFKILAGGAGITVGDNVSLEADHDNTVHLSPGGDSQIVGIALEDFGDTQYGLVELRPSFRNVA